MASIDNSIEQRSSVDDSHERKRKKQIFFPDTSPICMHVIPLTFPVFLLQGTDITQLPLSVDRSAGG